MRDSVKQELITEAVNLLFYLVIVLVVVGLTWFATSCQGYQASPYVEGSYGEGDGFGVNDASDRFQANTYPGWSMTVGVSLVPPVVRDDAQFERMIAAMRKNPDPYPYIRPEPSKPKTDEKKKGTIVEIGDAAKKIGETRFSPESLVFLVILLGIGAWVVVVIVTSRKVAKKKNGD